MNTKHLMVVAVLEGLVMTSAVIRVAIPGLGIDFDSPAHLGWLLTTIMLAAASVAHLVLRNAGLNVRAAKGEAVEDDRKQVLIVSLAILAAALLLSLSGPQAVAALFG